MSKPEFDQIEERLIKLKEIGVKNFRCDDFVVEFFSSCFEEEEETDEEEIDRL